MIGWTSVLSTRCPAGVQGGYGVRLPTENRTLGHRLDIDFRQVVSNLTHCKITIKVSFRHQDSNFKRLMCRRNRRVFTSILALFHVEFLYIENGRKSVSWCPFLLLADRWPNFSPYFRIRKRPARSSAAGSPICRKRHPTHLFNVPGVYTGGRQVPIFFRPTT